MRDERGSAADGGVSDAPDDDSASTAVESPEPAQSPEPAEWIESAESLGCAESLDSAELLVCAEDDAQPPVVRRPSQLSREERAFLDRFRQDMPPHHDSSWG